MSDKLEACPLCAGDELSHGWESPGVDGSPNTGTVQCHSCNLLLWADTEAEAIAAWNTRTPTPEQAGEVELREALTDANIVHLNMLRGGIAKPSPAQIWHIYGEELLAAMPAALQSTTPAQPAADAVESEYWRCLNCGQAHLPPAPDEKLVERLKNAASILDDSGPDWAAVQEAISALTASGLGPIPAGVYYVAEAGNFYDAATRKGRGNAFHAKWHSRRNDFPTDADAALPTTMAGDYVMVPRDDALAQALCLLDTFAGEGLAHTYGNGQVLDAAGVCTELAEAYGIECEPGWWRTVANRAASPTGGE